MGEIYDNGRTVSKIAGVIMVGDEINISFTSEEIAQGTIEFIGKIEF